MKLSWANGSLAAWLTRVAGTVRDRNKVQATDTALSMHNVPQITPGWDYRPKDVIRRDAAFGAGRAGPADAVNSSASTPSQNGDAWFDFASLEPPTERVRTITPSSDDAGKISTYD